MSKALEQIKALLTEMRRMTPGDDEHVASILTDYADRIDTALQALRGGGWLPIESAPKDGSYILVANYGDEADEAYWHDGSDNHWGEAGWYYADADRLTSHPCKPDVWMAKPSAPPSPAKEDGRG